MTQPDSPDTAPLPPQPVHLGRRQALHADWQLAASAPDAYPDPAALAAANLAWRAAVVPGTVAQSMGTTVDTAGAFDAQDWWYRCTFVADDSVATGSDASVRLFFEGLATLAEVWLNGAPILSSRSMFAAHRAAIGSLLREDNELVICFRSLNAALAGRHPRPRWKTTLVEQQALRWIRTTLLGRVPGWMPPIEPVGPWRGIFLEYPAALEVVALDLQTSARGSTGSVAVDVALSGATAPDTATLCIGNRRFGLPLTHANNTARIAATISVAAMEPWWPHTHGTPNLYDCAIELDTAGTTQRIDCGRIGFKEIALGREAGRVQLRINGADVFCRGACWTTDDIVALQSAPDQLRQTLQLLRDAGANMVRVGGTMLYESDAFYTLCDELGLLVWQDFMFASMDYPFEDAQFRDAVELEVAEQLTRWQKHPCIAVYCGNSEVEQQAAMVGLPSSEWSHEFFSAYLPRQCARLHRDIPYFASTPSEGAMPFHVSSGLSHYYSVSAYRRPLTDVKHAQVKFATECLCFANVPEPQTMALLHNGTLLAPHHPRWKERIGSNPANFDFEAIRDDYLKTLFKVEPSELKHCDLERYYALSRVVGGELMKSVFAEWRRAGSTCGGGLIWFYKDFWPGAGWGFVDSTNRPKAAYWYLRRAWAPQALLITDESLDGLQLQCINDSAAILTAKVELRIYQHGRITLAQADADVKIPAQSAVMLSAEAMLGRFFDINYTYRFGPPKHDVVAVRMLAADGTVLSEDFYFPLGLALPRQESPNIRKQVEFASDGTVIVTLHSEAFLQSVSFTVDDFLPDDNYFHLIPNLERRIVFTPARTGIVKFKAYLSALNSSESVTLRAERT